MGNTPNIEFSNQAMKRISALLVSAIIENTLKGIGADGKPLKAYSSSPFAMPYGAVKPKSAIEILIKNKEATVFMKKGKKHWVVIEGGYVSLRKAAKKGTDVNMSWTGRMLGALRPISITNDTITIGFNREEEAKKAYWHIVAGAGKSKVKRDFLGLPDAEIIKIVSDEINSSSDLIVN